MQKDDLIHRWFNEYHDDIYNYLVYYFGRKDVEDFVQEAFLKAFQNIGRYEGRSSPKTWLISIARNVAIDHFRKNRVSRFLPISLLKKAASEEKSPLDLVLEDETKQELYDMIKKMKPAYRDVLILRGIMQLTPNETASILGWEKAKVNLSFHRGIESLKKMSTEQKGGTRNAAINE
ncbi:RNA polymerase sigma factor [Neobacillus notoginsengisoli]|uniref:RNA polymerase sigma factor n=1 Tax=Neobacillus notoginsengisoli TaxID=1578198 RepID=A0A417YPC6_9BACI|nr:RNA polymerase sigma factor [Neobacillus notoginsengisoli]RHW35682.1 RNA polymerase sigma factor [Neobacillus notoginsengisoli]